MSEFRFDLDEFLLLAKDRLLAEVPAEHRRGDDDLNAGSRILPADAQIRQAAVLVPIIAREPELNVLLTQRTEALKSHSGQIAFPGGKIETSDSGPAAAALREACEEIGLCADRVEPVGYLDGYLTGTAFHIVPVVGLVRPGFTLTPDHSEVAAVFEVPLRFLMTRANHQRHSREWQGKTRHFYAMPFEDRYIWGATAGMLKNLYDRMYAVP